MLQRHPLTLPRHVYPIDPWRIVEKQFYPRFLGRAETIFTMANGYLGMRDYGGRLSFNSRLPKGLISLHFPLAVQGSVLEIEIKAETATYRLRKGKQLTFQHQGQELSLAEGESRSLQLDFQTGLL